MLRQNTAFKKKDIKGGKQKKSIYYTITFLVQIHFSLPVRIIKSYGNFFDLFVLSFITTHQEASSQILLLARRDL